MKSLKILGAIAIAALVVALILSFTPARREAAFYPMGGIPFKVVAYGRTPWQFRGDMVAVEARVAELEGVFNRFMSSSELSRIDRSAAVAPVAVSSEMAGLIKKSREWHAKSSGAFDPTVGPLVGLWKRAGKAGRLPSQAEIDDARHLVGLDMVSQVGADRLFFAREGMHLDFGAIAKGAMLDEVAELLKKRGVQRGVVDAGGNALAFGNEEFVFGIADPLVAGHQALMGTIKVPQGAVITSGNYERFVEIGGKRYSHIIDPRTGMTVENGLIAVTVIGGSGADADALATAIMVLGREGASDLLSALLPERAFILVEEGKEGPRVFASETLHPSLTLLGPWAGRIETLPLATRAR